MKTDRFDEEFRRKLNELSEESSPDEVDRICGYVSQHLPTATRIRWTGWAAYLTGGLLGLGFLLYSLRQHQAIMTLQNTVDSLRTAPPALVQKSVPVVAPIVRIDTVYVTRYQDRPQYAPAPLDKPLSLLADTQTAQPLPENHRNRLDILYPNQAALQTKDPATTRIESAGITTSGQLIKSTPNGRNQPVHPTARTATEISMDSSGTTMTEPTVKPIDPKTPVAVQPETSPEPDAASPLRNNILANTNVSNRRGVLPAKTRHQTKSTDRVSEVAQPMVSKATMNRPDSDFVDTDQLADESEKQLMERVVLATNLITSKSLTAGNLSAIIKRQPVYQPASVPAMSPVRKSFRLHLPTVSLANAQYFSGAGFSLGNQQLGGSLLGEIRLRPRWSVQVGVHLLSQTGFQYHSADEFEQTENQDFRALYAPNVAPGDEIQNIDQTYTILQLPLTVAYHYPLGRSWALRLGVGTTLDLLAQSRVTFDFERNGLDFEQGLKEGNVPVRLFNNATVSLGLERQWKRLLLRASPFVSPQIKWVGYRVEAIYWGGQVQVLWQFK